jgi:hypothetical protein
MCPFSKSLLTSKKRQQEGEERGREGERGGERGEREIHVRTSNLNVNQHIAIS